MSEFVFVSDVFVEDYAGGAELTSEALIAPYEKEVIKIKSSNVSKEIVDQNRDKRWIFGNFYSLSLQNIMYIIKSNIDYSIIEYDYKICKYRSKEKHTLVEGSCNCHETPYGKLIHLFFRNSNMNWFMSEYQRQVYLDSKSVTLEKSKVLSSIFSRQTLDLIDEIRQENTTKTNKKYIILNSASWIKGTQDAIAYANKESLEYELVSGLSYNDMLDKIGSSYGLIFLPKASDTCPRIVIEAKLLGCDLVLNENVSHKNEKWFSTNNLDEIKQYLESRVSYFWREYERE
jgi:hypothetical protein